MAVDAYAKRFVSFFLSSIRELKTKSGGQRWNAICEDTVRLYVDLAQTHLGILPLQPEEMWHLLFDPPQESLLLEHICKDQATSTLLFRLLHALLDPPPQWWAEQA